MYPMMENHDFALQMQKDFIKNIEAKNPKYVLFVNVSTSWLYRPDSHLEVLKWFGDYRKRALRLVGVVELSNDRTLYHWPQTCRGKSLPDSGSPYSSGRRESEIPEDTAPHRSG
jgi:hypothetical protein